MKANFYFPCILLTLFYYSLMAQKELPGNRMVIEGAVPVGFRSDSVGLQYYSSETVTSLSSNLINLRKKTTPDLIKWVFYANKPQNVTSGLLAYRNTVYLLEPGDSVHINTTGGRQVFSGKGSAKFALITKLEEIITELEHSEQFKNLPAKYLQTASLKEYQDWNAYIKFKLSRLIPLIEASRGQLSDYAYRWIKTKYIVDCERDRLDKFYLMMLACIYRNAAADMRGPDIGLSASDLDKIADTTLYRTEAGWVRNNGTYALSSYFWSLNQVEAVKADGFKLTDNFEDRVKKYGLHYRLGKTNFKGIAREKVLHEVVTLSIDKLGFIPEVETMLKDYYQQPGFPEYKQWMKVYESNTRTRRLGKGRAAPAFALTDVNGKVFTSAKIKGKITFLDFWFTGCVGCAQMVPGMRQVEERFKNDTNVVFLSVSIDKQKETWLKSVRQQRYTTGGSINLYTGGQEKNHAIIRDYNVDSYPTVYLIDPYGQVVRNPTPDPRGEGGKQQLIALIEAELTKLNDGPYVLYKNGQPDNHYLYGQTKSKVSAISAATDVKNKRFSITLKPSLQAERSAYEKPEKIFLLSDIEGNFGALRKLLLFNKIIDGQFNWTFGNGHLVFAGDMFDRGDQVTECLWLIYALEEKAKAAGGYVHFILGNHELMNLRGDERYVQPKYKRNSLTMGEPIRLLYSENSELGRWLRTKNIMEKVGDLLITHGGISPDVSRLPLGIDAINKLARPYYSDTTTHYANKTVDAIMGGYAPFWYRLYYEDEKKRTPVSTIDSTLLKFDVKHIVTGHTITEDTVSMHYGGKVFNTDVHHSEGKSEALLIEGDKFYRVNDKGERHLLFNEDKKKTKSN